MTHGSKEFGCEFGILRLGPQWSHRIAFKNRWLTPGSPAIKAGSCLSKITSAHLCTVMAGGKSRLSHRKQNPGRPHVEYRAQGHPTRTKQESTLSNQQKIHSIGLGWRGFKDFLKSKGSLFIEQELILILLK